MKREVPIFLFNGLIESGKTTMIQRMLQNPELTNGRKIMLIVCEEGIEEFDADAYLDKNVHIVSLDEETGYTKAFFTNIEKNEKPDYVIIEYNGMWNPEMMVTAPYPAGWQIAQIMTLVNSQTFQNYYANMRVLFANHYKMTDMVVYNRFEDSGKFDMFAFRSACKAQNMRMQVVFEYTDGRIDTEFDASPFDLTKSVIEIPDADFPTWYFDMMDNAEKYDGKTVRVFCNVAHLTEPGQHGFVIGRHVMTCCAEDIQFMGVYCINDMNFEDETFAMITAKVKAVTGDVYGEDPGEILPVLQVSRIEKRSAPEEPVLMM